MDSAHLQYSISAVVDVGFNCKIANSMLLKRRIPPPSVAEEDKQCDDLLSCM